jgi:hypothetical protein
MNDSVIEIHGSVGSRLGTNSNPLYDSMAGGLALESVWIVPSSTKRKDVLSYPFTRLLLYIDYGHVKLLTFTYGRPQFRFPGPAKRVTAVVIVCAANEKVKQDQYIVSDHMEEGDIGDG